MVFLANDAEQSCSGTHVETGYRAMRGDFLGTRRRPDAPRGHTDRTARMKIVGVANGPPFDPRVFSGSAAHLFRALQQQGVLETAVSGLAGKSAEYLFKAITVQAGYEHWRFRALRHPGLFAANSLAAKRRLRRVHSAYDVILQIGAWYDLTSEPTPVVSYHDSNLASLLRSPYARHISHDTFVERALAYEEGIYSRVRRLYTMSTWAADTFVRECDVDAKRLSIVGVGVNLPRIADTRQKTYDRRSILFVGKDFVRKGGPVLLEAFRFVRREVPDATLTIIGPRRRIVGDGINHLGFQKHGASDGLSTLLRAYSDATVFTMPSQYEPFGIVFAEAMAHRTPCIGAAVCAMPEIIGHGLGGYVVPPQDAKALAGRLIELLRDPAQAKTMGEFGYQRYLERYHWDRVADRIAEETRAVLS